MKSILSFLSQLPFIKKVYIFLTPFVTMFSSMSLAVIALFILILLDLLTGIVKSHAFKKVKFNPFSYKSRSVIKSYLLRQTWKKTYEYLIGILAIFVLEFFLLKEIHIELLDQKHNLTRWAIIFAGSVELWSIFENIEVITGKNLLKKTIGILPESIKKLFKQ